MKHFNLDLVRVTEAGAIAAARWIGSGDKLAADKEATDAMRDRFNRIDFSGIITIGEGEKDRSHGMFFGEKVGSQWSYKDNAYDIYSIAIDPIEGTTPTVTGGPEAISTIAVANEDCFYKTDAFYMNKLAYGPHILSRVLLHIDEPIEKTIDRICGATNRTPNEVVVCILNRPRHDEIIARLRALSVRIKLINDCDVSGAIATCLPDSGIDFLIGIGGAPESVISAAAIKCLGGDFQSHEVDKEWKQSGPILGKEDLVRGDCIFVATGITNGSILKGVRMTESGPITNSVSMRSESGTIRWITAQHGN